MRLFFMFLAIEAASAFTYPLPVHNITRFADLKFENLAVRSNGQILTTIAGPTASLYQVDPLDILPRTLIHTLPNITGFTGIAEGKHDIFYVASASFNPRDASARVPDSYRITEIDVRGVNVFPNGTLSRLPAVRTAAALTQAGLPNGITFPQGSEHLLVADTLRGLIWRVELCSGAASVALNDSSTRGKGGENTTGVNGVKVHNGSLFYTNTGTSELWSVPVSAGGVVQGRPKLLASNITCDDLVLDHKGVAYVASPEDVISKVDPFGALTVIAGSFASNSSSLVGPTALRFGRLASDRWSLYVTTNGGLRGTVAGSAGVSRIDLGEV